MCEKKKINQRMLESEMILESAYYEMAADPAREAGAHDWSEGLMGELWRRA